MIFPTAHPEMVRRYRHALEQYRRPGIAEACSTLGMSQRAYCDRIVEAFGPLHLTTTTMSPLWWFSGDDAYATAAAIHEGTD